MYARFALRSAVTWRIVTELFRRHHQRCSLRVYELHPGGGQYDCLAITAAEGDDPAARQIAHFNIGSQHVHVFHTYGGTRVHPDEVDLPEADYVVPFLKAHDPREVVDRVERLLDLPRVKGPLPSSTPAVLGLRVIAGILERHALARQPLDAWCAWHDSSGMEGSDAVMEWIAPFPALKAKLEALPPFSDWRPAARIAGRIWRVGPVGVADRGVLLDLGTCEACALGASGDRISLWDRYGQVGRRLAPLLDWVEERL